MPKITTLFAPDSHSTVDTVSTGRDAVYAVDLSTTSPARVLTRFRPSDGRWSDAKLALPKGGSTAVVSANDWGPDAHFTYESFLQPPTLYEDAGDGKVTAIKSQAPLFDAKNIVSEQFWATSADGTKVPYFLIHRAEDTNNVPTILYSYGGLRAVAESLVLERRPPPARRGAGVALQRRRDRGRQHPRRRRVRPGLASGGAEGTPPARLRRFRRRRARISKRAASRRPRIWASSAPRTAACSPP